MVSVNRPFYVTLPSDASCDVFPKNSAASWTTRLRAPISLQSGIWEVALVELIYPHSMYNIPEEQKIIVQQVVLIGKCDYWEDAEEEIRSYRQVLKGLAPLPRKPSIFMEIRFVEEKEEFLPRPQERTQGYFHFHEHEIVVPAGIYEITELRNIINSQIPALQPLTLGDDFKNIHNRKYTPRPGTLALQFNYSPSERKTRVTFPSLRVRLKFPPASRRLQEMLGFENQSIVSAVDSPFFQPQLVQRLKTNGHSSITSDTPLFFPPDSGPLIEADKTLWYIIHQTPPEFRSEVSDQESYLVISKRCINLSFGDQSLFIYCDVASFSHVGDSYEQLLRTVPIKTDSAYETVMVRFDVPHYSPVVRSFVETIAVDICTDRGIDAPFQSGKSLIKLHFRPAK